MNSLALAFTLYLLLNAGAGFYYAGKGKLEACYGRGYLISTSLVYGGIAVFLMVSST